MNDNPWKVYLRQDIVICQSCINSIRDALKETVILYRQHGACNTFSDSHTSPARHLLIIAKTNQTHWKLTNDSRRRMLKETLLTYINSLPINFEHWGKD